MPLQLPADFTASDFFESISKYLKKHYPARKLVFKFKKIEIKELTLQHARAIRSEQNAETLIAALDFMENSESQSLRDRATEIRSYLPRYFERFIDNQLPTECWNALMLAKHYHPDAVAPILKAMQSHEQRQILQQTTHEGCNALMMATRYHPDALMPILNAMQPLELYEKRQILQHTNHSSWNALMMAACYNPDAVAPILEAMQSLEPQEQWQILQQINSKRFNTLMLAARHNPDAVAPILEAMQFMDPDKKRQILQQTPFEGSNALMLAARYSPDAVRPILNAMQSLEPFDHCWILQQKNYGGSTALMLATCYNPQCTDPIISALESINPDQRQAILPHTNTEGKNSLQFVMASDPHAVRDAGLYRLDDNIPPPPSRPVPRPPSSGQTAPPAQQPHSAPAFSAVDIENEADQHKTALEDTVTDENGGKTTLEGQIYFSFCTKASENQAVCESLNSASGLSEIVSETKCSPCEEADSPRESISDHNYKKQLEKASGVLWTAEANADEGITFQATLHSGDETNKIIRTLKVRFGLQDQDITVSSSSSGPSVLAITKDSLLATATRQHAFKGAAASSVPQSANKCHGLGTESKISRHHSGLFSSPNPKPRADKFLPEIPAATG